MYLFTVFHMYNEKDIIFFLRIQHNSFTNIKNPLVFPEEILPKIGGVQSSVIEHRILTALLKVLAYHFLIIIQALYSSDILLQEYKV